MSNRDTAPDVEAIRLADEAFARLSVDAWLSKEEHRLEFGAQHAPSGWPLLDEALGGGFLVPSLVVLGAAPKAFKSTWTQIVVTRHVEAGGFAYLLDLENGRNRFLRRMLCRKAELGQKAVAAALRKDERGVFRSPEEARRWQEAKAWLHRLRRNLYVEFTAPGGEKDVVARLRAAKRAAGGRKLLIAIDSLHKLPTDYADRRSSTDKWIRLLERLRDDLDAVIIVVSEIKRDFRGGYTANESAFKETGGIEYTADLALTLTKDAEAGVSTLRVELARDCEEDPIRPVASYATVRPHYGLEEQPPAERTSPKRRGPPATKAEAAREFLESQVDGVAREKGELLSAASSHGIRRSTLYDAAKALGLADCTVNLKPGWRRP